MKSKTAISTSRDTHLSAINGTNWGVFYTNHDLRFTRIEAAAQQNPFAAYDVRHLIGLSVWSVFQGEARSAFHSVLKQLLEESGNTEKDAAVLAWRTRVMSDGPVYLFETARDPSGFVTRFQALHQTAPASPGGKNGINTGDFTTSTDSLTGVLFQHCADPIAALDLKGRVRQSNQAFIKTFGDVGANREKSLSLLNLIHPDERSAAAAHLLSLKGENGEDMSRLTCRCCNQSGEYRWFQWSFSVAATSELLWCASGRDITESRAYEEEMRRRAYHDPLTGLPNRSLLQDRLQSALAAAPRRNATVAVLLFDLDRFKRINDTFGHAAGDEALVEVAQRLRMGLRDEDTVARLGGDEFVVVLPAVRDMNDAFRVAEKLMARLSQPAMAGGRSVRLGASVGVAVAPHDGNTPSQLLAAADMAMYRLKRGASEPSADSLHLDISPQALPDRILHTRQTPPDDMEIEARLGVALERREMLLYYQPQICLSSNRIVGVEALMRWNPHEIAPIAPGRFIPVAEESGLIFPLGEWALREACQQAREWQKAGIGVRVAVNVSASQLTDNRFPDRVSDCLRDAGIQACQMEMELTEGTFVRDDGAALETLSRLRALGIGLFVDDFGTGYANLSYLRRFPIDGLKVDRSFITSVDTNPADAAVVRSIVDLSGTLGLKVIAEGVETTAQRDTLRDLGCDVMQGFLFGVPAAPHDMASLLT